MNKTKRWISALLVALLAVAVWLPLTTAAADEPTPKLILTEICYNPTFVEGNDKDLEDSADVLEYVEVVNVTGEAISMEGLTLRYSKDGDEGPFKQNTVLLLAESGKTLAPGEVAVIAVYNADTAKAGLGYATPEEQKAYYDFFAEFYGCAEDLDSGRFYVSPAVESGTGDSIADGFRLGNQNENVTVQLTNGEGDLLCEVNYDATLWNRNGWSMNLIYRSGLVEGHPLASEDLNIAACTPGVLRENQISAAGLAPTGATMSLKVMEYNICATASTQARPDGSTMSMEERMDLVMDYMIAQAPDVIGLCEVNYVWFPALEAKLTGEGGAYSAYGRSGRGATFGAERYNKETWDLYSLILWNTEKYDLVEQGSFWGSKTPSRPNSCNWDGYTGDMGRAMNWVILKDKQTGTEFFFLCAHLDAKVDEVRTLTADLITKQVTELAAGRPVIMVGDWNANENRESYDIMAYGDYADARYLVADPADMTIYNTYNKWGEYTDQLTTRPPIDHCFVSRGNVFVERAAMDPVYVEGTELYSADHNATLFDLLVTAAQSPEPEVTTEAVTDAAPESAADTTADTTVGTTVDTTVDTTADATDTEAEAGKESGCGSSVLSVTLLALLPAAGLLLRAGEGRKKE